MTLIYKILYDIHSVLETQILLKKELNNQQSQKGFQLVIFVLHFLVLLAVLVLAIKFLIYELALVELIRVAVQVINLFLHQPVSHVKTLLVVQVHDVRVEDLVVDLEDLLLAVRLLACAEVGVGVGEDGVSLEKASPALGG